MGGTYLVPMRIHCTPRKGLKNTTREGLSYLSLPLKRVIRIVKLGLPCQILVQCWSGLLHDLSVVGADPLVTP